jgi:hypothetical protein
MQKMVFYPSKAMLWHFKIYALGKSMLIFDQINEKISLDEKSDL